MSATRPQTRSDPTRFKQITDGSPSDAFSLNHYPPCPRRSSITPTSAVIWFLSGVAGEFFDEYNSPQAMVSLLIPIFPSQSASPQPPPSSPSSTSSSPPPPPIFVFFGYTCTNNGASLKFFTISTTESLIHSSILSHILVNGQVCDGRE
ncbi:hypothetical protein O6P43_014844 [Quillaja saponaria]|uniref:Uncharacterized protein n=1 Tax=Quillaja saponaria TaxID=32244 RepID=A0AAD7LXE9_QUISA|nr:hypothetical protein O6P43_014844 [Quillaja saponaria]